MSELHVRIPWLYFFEIYTSILQTSSEDLKWRATIHGAKKYEAKGDSKGEGLLWKDSKASSWFTSIN
jgi:hypothetical protein